MAERPDEPESESQEALDQASPAATALALGRTGKGGKALDIEATAFLRDQRRLINLQTEHLHEQRELQISHLRWRRFSDRMKATLQVMTAAVGLAVVAVVAAMAWSAHEDHGLVVEAFSTPPDMAQRGLTGQVAATKLLDRLRDLQAASPSTRAQDSFANDWGDDIKVEIPETGVSIGELDRYLRQALGHETHISGEIARTADGLEVSVRVGGEAGVSFSGKEADLDQLMVRAADAVYRQTQPYRYGLYLTDQNRFDEAKAIFADLATSGSPRERAWALLPLGTVFEFEGSPGQALATWRRGLDLDPDNAVTQGNVATVEHALGRDAQALAGYLRAVRILKSHDNLGLNPLRAEGVRLRHAGDAEQLLGDFTTARSNYAAAIAFPASRAMGVVPAAAAESAALQHDASAARRDLDGPLPPPMSGLNQGKGASILRAQVLVDVALDDWSQATVDIDRAATFAADKPYVTALIGQRFLQPWRAYAEAKTGDVASAQALIAATPLDCYPCLRLRGRIAAEAANWPDTDRWFVEAVRQAPMIPMAYSEWGEVLLAKGDVDGAIAKLTLAHEKGPRFADPLELWGEALMRKGDFAGAAAKFAEADKDAPRWGRNHLRWGEALAKLGKSDEAKAQWRAAAGMDLSVADRAELTQVQAHG